MIEELKPCPFCGCTYLIKGKAICKDEYGDKVDGYYIECLNCHVKTPCFLKSRRNEVIILWQERTDKPDISKTVLLKRTEELDQWD